MSTEQMTVEHRSKKIPTDESTHGTKSTVTSPNSNQVRVTATGRYLPAVVATLLSSSAVARDASVLHHMCQEHLAWGCNNRIAPCRVPDAKPASKFQHNVIFHYHNNATKKGHRTEIPGLKVYLNGDLESGDLLFLSPGILQLAPKLRYVGSVLRRCQQKPSRNPLPATCTSFTVRRTSGGYSTTAAAAAARGGSLKLRDSRRKPAFRYGFCRCRWPCGLCMTSSR